MIDPTCVVKGDARHVEADDLVARVRGGANQRLAEVPAAARDQDFPAAHVHCPIRAIRS